MFVFYGQKCINLENQWISFSNKCTWNVSPNSQAFRLFFSRIVNLLGSMLWLRTSLVSFDLYCLTLNRWYIAVYCNCLYNSCLSVYLSVYQCFHELNLIVNSSPAQLSLQAIILLEISTIYNCKVYKQHWYSKINEWFQNL